MSSLKPTLIEYKGINKSKLFRFSSDMKKAILSCQKLSRDDW